MTCPHSGKHMHETRADATRAMVRIGKKSGQEVYRCRHCGTFHFGHAVGMNRQPHWRRKGARA